MEKIHQLNLKNREAIILISSLYPEGILYDRRHIKDLDIFYLTGINKDNIVIVIKKEDNHIQSHIFTEYQTKESKIWNGILLNPELLKKYDKIHNIALFNRLLPNILKGSSKVYIKSKNKMNCLITGFNGDLVKLINKIDKRIQIKSYIPIIKKLRMVKNKSEIDSIKKAIDVTKIGIDEVIKNIKAGVMEYELEAIFEYIVKRNNVFELAFNPIIASGKNSCVIHYWKNYSSLKKNKVLLIDVGCKVKGFCSDISRSFFVGNMKNISSYQKELYQAVLSINKEIIKMVKPNILISDLTKKAKELVYFALKDMGKIKKINEVKKYFMHSVSHHLGLEPHDLSDFKKPLEKGNIITIEPGIYDSENSIGVRIEDDILVTKDGYINLSKKIKK